MILLKIVNLNLISGNMAYIDSVIKLALGEKVQKKPIFKES